MATPRDANPRQGLTVEAVIAAEGGAEGSTVISVPAGSAWVPPFAIYRLCFAAGSLTPVFEVLVRTSPGLVSVSAPAPIPPDTPTHISGTFDGQAARLFVNGNLVAERLQAGAIVGGTEPSTIGCRSSTDPGDYYVGLMYEARLFSYARTPEQIAEWTLKPLPAPGGDGCEGLWSAWG
jgi:hypothetical protein